MKQAAASPSSTRAAKRTLIKYITIVLLLGCVLTSLSLTPQPAFAASVVIDVVIPSALFPQPVGGTVCTPQPGGGCGGPVAGLIHGSAGKLRFTGGESTGSGGGTLALTAELFGLGVETLSLTLTGTYSLTTLGVAAGIVVGTATGSIREAVGSCPVPPGSQPLPQWDAVFNGNIATINFNCFDATSTLAGRVLRFSGRSDRGDVTVTAGPPPTPSPHITSLSPTSAPVGTSVTISGSNFGATQGTSSATFDSTAASVQSWSDTQIHVTVPSLLIGDYDVVVTTSAGSSNAVLFNVLCGVPGGGLPIFEQITIPQSCGNDTAGLTLQAIWGQFRLRDVLRFNSGEELEVRCVSIDGGEPAYHLLYTPPPSKIVQGCPTFAGKCRVGICPFHGGCNFTWFAHSGDNLKTDGTPGQDGNPDCLIRTRWISKDYGRNDHIRFGGGWEPFENELDWAMSLFEANKVQPTMRKYSARFPYQWGPPIGTDRGEIEAACNGNFAVLGQTQIPEGPIASSIEVIDPPLGPETEQFFDGVSAVFEAIPSSDPPMVSGSIRLCDLNHDGRCDAVDRGLFQNILGTCLGDAGYQPLFDVDGNECIDRDDEHVVFDQDIDDDGIPDAIDNCPTVPNPDQVALVISSVSANPSTLWPPNHKMVPVSMSVAVTDICDAAPVCRIISVSSNEPVNGLGDGDTSPDWEITGNLAVNLRAERSGKGNGRVYTNTVACTDASGNSSTKTVAVTVPHDQGKK